ncbi:MAG: exo-alpha-sialidase [Promethearchaeota archaeon]
MYKEGSIPGRPEAHASTLVAGPRAGDLQRLFCAWFCGTREGHVDVAILFSTISYDAGSPPSMAQFTYSKPFVVADEPERSLGNPVLFWEPGGALHLWYASSDPDDPDDRDLRHQTSPDLGLTWGSTTTFSPRKGLFTRNHLLVLEDGTWLLPLGDEVTYNKRYKTYWSSVFALSHDRGESWSLSGLYSVKPKGMIQPTVVQRGDGSLFCLNRTRNGWLAGMESRDGGHTWSTPGKTPLPNPNSAVCMVRHSSGDLVLAYNPTREGRTPLSIARSSDGGRTWERLFDLRAVPGSFSYPSLCETPDGLVHCSYTHDRRTIAHDALLLA